MTTATPITPANGMSNKMQLFISRNDMAMNVEMFVNTVQFCVGTNGDIGQSGNKADFDKLTDNNFDDLVDNLNNHVAVTNFFEENRDAILEFISDCLIDEEENSVIEVINSRMKHDNYSLDVVARALHGLRASEVYENSPEFDSQKEAVRYLIENITALYASVCYECNA